MHDLGLVQVVDAEHYLLEDVKSLIFLELFFNFELVVQLLPFYQLGHHVEILLILVKAIYVHDVGVVLTIEGRTMFLRISNSLKRICSMLGDFDF